MEKEKEEERDEEEDKEGKRWGEGKMEREVEREWDTADNKQHPFKDHSKDRGLPSFLKPWEYIN